MLQLVIICQPLVFRSVEVVVFPVKGTEKLQITFLVRLFG